MGRPKKDQVDEKINNARLIEEHGHFWNEVNSALTVVKGSFDHLSRTFGEYTRFVQQNAHNLGLPESLAVGDLPLPYSYQRYNPLLRDTTESKTEPAQPLNKRRKTTRPYKKRDPDAPKRPLTSFFLFLNAGRDVIKKDLGEKFGGVVNPRQVTEEATRRFKELSAEERAEWDKVYEEKKQKYNEEIEVYNANKDPKKDGALVEDEEADDSNKDQDDESPAESSGQAQAAADIGAEVDPTEEDEEDEEVAYSSEGEEEEEETQKPEPPPPAKQPSPVRTKINPPKTAKKQDGSASKEAAPKPSAAQVHPTAVPPTKTPIPRPKLAKQTAVPLPSSDSNKASETEPTNGGAEQYNFPIDPKIIAEETAKDNKRKADGKEQSPEQPKKKKKKVKDGVQPPSSSIPDNSSETVVPTSAKPETKPVGNPEGKPEGKKKKKKTQTHAAQLSQAAQG